MQDNFIGYYRLKKKFDITVGDANSNNGIIITNIHIPINANTRFYVYDNGYYYTVVSAAKSGISFNVNYDDFDSLFGK